MFNFKKNGKATEKKDVVEKKSKNRTNINQNKPVFYKRPIFYLIMLVILMITILSTLIIYRVTIFLGVGDNSLKNIPILYIQENRLMYKNQLMDSPAVADESLNWIDNYNTLENSTLMTEKGDYLLYMDNIKNESGDLFLKYVYKDKKRKGETEAEGKLISKNVVMGEYKFTNEKNNVVYLKKDGTLNISAKNKEYFVDNTVKKIVGVDDNDIIYYLKCDSEKNKYELLSFDSREKNSSPVIIDKGVVSIYSFDDNGTVMYQQNDLNEPNKNIVKKYRDGKIDIMCENSEAVVDIGDDGQIFFTKRNKKVTEYLKLYTDKYLDEDADIKEPDKKDFTKEKKNKFGNTKTVFDEKGYNLAKKKYDDKVRRDEIREALNQDYRVFETLTFMFNAGTSETTIADKIEKIILADANSSTSVYATYTFTMGGRKDLDEYKSAEEAIEETRLALDEPENYHRVTYFSKIGSKPMVINEGDYVTSAVFEDGNYLYYTYYDDSNKLKLAYRIFDGVGLTEEVIVNSNIKYLYPEKYNGDIIYIASDDDKVTLYKLDNGKGSILVSQNEDMLIYDVIDKSILLKGRYVESRNTGDLYLYNGKERLIDENVYEASYRTDKYIYALKNYDSVLGGDLYLYDNRKAVLLGSDVKEISYGGVY